MNITPVSFGKVVEVKGNTTMTAYNIASLANSRVEDKTHSAIQKDAKRIFDDVTPNGPVRVFNWNNGKKMYLLSGEDSECAGWYAEYGRNDIAEAKKHMPEGKERERFISDVKKETADNIKRYIISHCSPYAITVAQEKGEFHLLKQNVK